MNYYQDELSAIVLPHTPFKNLPTKKGRGGGNIETIMRKHVVEVVCVCVCKWDIALKHRVFSGKCIQSRKKEIQGVFGLQGSRKFQSSVVFSC